MRYLLISEGSSDRLLFEPIDWLMRTHCSVPFSKDWVNPSALDDNSRVLSIRLAQAMKFYPCDIAFVHRDTDTSTIENRVNEILTAATDSGYVTPIVCVVPVRMTEAWFLFSESAIRRAADKPNSNVALGLPNAATCQRRADPKVLLEEALITASELSGRRLDGFKREMSRRKMLVASHVDDYSPLRAHSSFQRFESELMEKLDSLGALVAS